MGTKKQKNIIAAISGLIVTATCITAFATTPLIPLDPEVPWRGDPDLSAVDDEYLLQLWDNTVIAYRRANPTGNFVGALARCSKYTDVPKTNADQEYLIAALARALDEDPINWDKVRVIIVLMYAGMEADARIPALAEQLFTLPRPMKMSDARSTAYREMLRLLYLQQSDDAAAVLHAATYREFWGDDPFHTRSVGRNSELAIVSLRRLAFTLLSFDMPAHIAIPYVEKMVEVYPEAEEPEEPIVLNSDTPAEQLEFTRQLIRNRLEMLQYRLEQEEAAASAHDEQQQ